MQMGPSNKVMSMRKDINNKDALNYKAAKMFSLAKESLDSNAA